jgi:8-oxo-dGTP pyrophosphatase MutT (NUDIX family)
MDYAGVILVREDKKVLLQLRANNHQKDNPNMWGTFGGKIEPGETPIKAAIREIFEELEIKLNEKDIKLW